MTLQEFVSEALVQIHGGVGDAQARGAKASPAGLFHSKSLPVSWEPATSAPVAHVAFDVALTPAEPAGIEVVSLTRSGITAEAFAAASRVSFGVPLVLPTGGG